MATKHKFCEQDIAELYERIDAATTEGELEEISDEVEDLRQARLIDIKQYRGFSEALDDRLADIAVVHV